MVRNGAGTQHPQPIGPARKGTSRHFLPADVPPGTASTPYLKHRVSLRQYKGLSVLGYQRAIGIWPQIIAGSLFSNSVLHKSHLAPSLRLTASIPSATIARLQETPGTGCRNSNRILSGSRRQPVLPCTKDPSKGARWESCQRQMIPFSLKTKPCCSQGQRCNGSPSKTTLKTLEE